MMEEVVKKRKGRPKGSVNYEGRPIGEYLYKTHHLNPKEQKTYIKEKKAILKDFGITLTYEEELEMRGMTDPLSIDICVRRILAKRLGVEY